MFQMTNGNKDVNFPLILISFSCM